MTQRKGIIRAAAVLAVLAAATTAWAGTDGFGAAGAASDADLGLQEMLVYAIEDEYLARGEYELIIGEYGNVRPFTNIIQAEARHIEWLTEVYDARGLSVPADASSAHVVLPESLEASLRTGVQAEIDNIAMYESFLSRELPDDVRDVFERLKSASENHLRAFNNNLRRYE